MSTGPIIIWCVMALYVLVKNDPILLLTLITVGTLASLRDGTADEFQRLGSLWIALAITMLAAQRNFFSWVLEKAKKSKFPNVEKLEAVKQSKFTSSHRVEFAIIVLGTLQWGYGDLFHCFVNGNGWNPC